ncbi:MAG: Uma2 family endonuclease [Bacteroidota bacterium]
MPSKLHSRSQTRLSNYLYNKYSNQFECFTELTLDTPGEKSVPDICICPLEQVDFSQDEIKRKDPPLATIEILSPTQPLDVLLEKTNDYFSFGVKSCWVVLPRLKTIYVYDAPNKYEVYSHGEELYDPNLEIRIPIDTIFAE